MGRKRRDVRIAVGKTEYVGRIVRGLNEGERKRIEMILEKYLSRSTAELVMYSLHKMGVKMTIEEVLKLIEERIL